MLICLFKVTMRKLYIGLFMALFTFTAANAGSEDGFFYADVQPKLTRCYPNPASVYINFEFAKEIDKTYTLHIFNFMGKKMTELKVANSKITVQLNDYIRGLYLYELKDRSNRIIESGKFQVVK